MRADDRDLVGGNPSRPVDHRRFRRAQARRMRRLADLTYPLNPTARPLSQRRPQNHPLRRSHFLRTNWLIEGIVDAKLTNCRAIELAESGLVQGSTSIDEAE